MATIDLIVLGMLKKEPLSAYDLQKLVEYRNILKRLSSWRKKDIFQVILKERAKCQKNQCIL